MMSWLEAPARFIVFTPLYLFFALVAFLTHSYRRWMQLLSVAFLLVLLWWLLSAKSGRLIFFSVPDGFFTGAVVFFIVWSLAGRFLSMRGVNGFFKHIARYCKRSILSPLPPEEKAVLEPSTLREPEPEKVEYIATIALDNPIKTPSAESAFRELPDTLKHMILEQS